MKWKKLGQVFNPTTWDDGVKRKWMKSHSQSVSTLVKDDCVRVYFSCRPKREAGGGMTSNTTWLDLDKNDLTKIIRVSDKPILPLGDLGSFDEHSVYPSSIIKVGDEVKFYYAGWYRCESVPFNCAIGLATSKDGGDTFKRSHLGPVLGPSPKEPFVISGPKIRKFGDNYTLYYLAGSKWIDHKGKPEVVYKLRMAFSQDGVNWVRHNQNIVSDVLGPNECQAGPDVFYKDGKYHMYFVYREGLDFRNKKGRGYKIGYAYSSDSIQWVRDDKNVGIEYSNQGWDSEMHHYPHVFNLDDKWYMLYNGNEFGKYGFGLAILEDE
tara:strand:+ start:2764 stop:3729 length:966 start_codon:yes stop_codon:yes gene_type:complete